MILSPASGEPGRLVFLQKEDRFLILIHFLFRDAEVERTSHILVFGGFCNTFGRCLVLRLRTDRHSLLNLIRGHDLGMAPQEDRVQGLRQLGHSLELRSETVLNVDGRENRLVVERNEAISLLANRLQLCLLKPIIPLLLFH